MNEQGFWAVVREARADADGCDAFAERVVDHLVTLPIAEIHDFRRVMDELLDRAYDWDLWGAAFVINGGCSDDGFEYFRSWLLTQGQQVYERALKEPDSLAAVTVEDCECEAFLYAPLEAIKRVSGTDALPSRYLPHPSEPAGTPLEEEELDARYPRLTAKFG